MTRPSMRDTPAEVESIIRSLPGRLRTDKVGGYAGIFHFDITGAKTPKWTIYIGDGACRVEEGHNGDPTCSVTMDETTFLNIETGKQNPVMAFVKGKIKVTNVGHMRKYDRAFFRFYDVPEA